MRKKGKQHKRKSKQKREEHRQGKGNHTIHSNTEAKENTKVVSSGKCEADSVDNIAYSKCMGPHQRHPASIWICRECGAVVRFSQQSFSV